MGLVQVGQLVTSKQGRDSGRKYVVVDFSDDNYVQVADGFIRKMTRPKRKNVKHLILHQACLGSATLDDKSIREFIAKHSDGESKGEEGS